MRRSVKSTKIISFFAGALIGAVAHANPVGPSVVHGDVSIAFPNAADLTVRNSPGAIINWQSFSIGASESTRFIQQNAASAVLNRVTGDQVSSLLGELTSNGRVFLINGNGIIVGQGATIDTAGLVMSTLDISNEDFLAGRFEFNGGEDAGQIVNRGYIKTAPGGEVILLAPRITNEAVAGIENSGLIETEDGELILAAGYSITITSLDDPDISFDVESSDGRVVNLGQLIAKGGSVEVLAGTIKHSGEINADALAVDEQGRVRLVANKRITTSAESIVSANGPGKGGDVHIEVVDAPVGVDDSRIATISGTVEANGGSHGGEVRITAEHVQLASAEVTANGVRGGGKVRIGGEKQGGPGLQAAENTSVSGDSRVSADALEKGEGGDVIVWSESKTDFNGYASARGGNVSGNGGFVEVSGKATLALQGSIDVGALNGRAGAVLLDPENVIIIPGSENDEILNPTPNADDRFSSSFSILPNGNILVRNQDADVGGLVDAGEIMLFDQEGSLLGMIEGSAANERLGSIFHSTVSNGNLVFRSPNAGADLSGAVILFNANTGSEIGRVSGNSANEQLGLNVDFFGGLPNSYTVRSPLADAGGNIDAGAIIFVDELAGTEISRVTGTAAGDMLGSQNLRSTVSGNFFLPVPDADVGGVMDAGSLFLLDGTDGSFIGRIDGNNTNERLSTNIDSFSFSPSTLITSPLHNNGAIDAAGAMILAADIDLGGGNIEIGRIQGSSPNEQLGSSGFQFLSNGNVLVRSPNADVGGVIDAGSLVLLDRMTGNEIGRLNGASAGEFLSNNGFVEAPNGNYWVPSFNADPGGVTDAGTLHLVDGSTGMSIGTFDGDTVNERFSSTFEQHAQLGFDKAIVRSQNHLGTRGVVGLFDSVDLGGGNIMVGAVTGTTAGDFVGSVPLHFLGNNNYIVAAPNFDDGSAIDAGRAFVVDDATGNSILTIFGNSAGEFLGAGNGIDISTLGDPDKFLVVSPGALADSGTIFFVDGSDTPSILSALSGANSGDRLGDEGIQSVPGGFLVPVPNADIGTATVISDAGSIFLVDGIGNIIGQQDGASAGERFGASVDTLALGNGDILVFNPLSDVGGTDSGQLLALDGNTLAPNWMINGTSANENLGNQNDFFNLSNGDLLFRSPLRDGVNMDEGAIFQVDPVTGLVGTIAGQSVNERLGSNFFFFSNSIHERSNGNYFVVSENASPMGVTSAGSVYLIDGASAGLIGQADGTSMFESFGFNINTFSLPGDDILVTSSTHTVGGNVNAGTVVQLAATDLGGTIIRGRLDGSSANEFFGNDGFQDLGNGNFVFFSRSADPGGRVDAGSIFLYDTVVGNILNQFDGAAAGDTLGESFSFVATSNFNFFLGNADADVGGIVDAGVIHLFDGATGNLIGSLEGNNTNEQLGGGFLNSFQFPDNLFVTSQTHNNGAFTNAGALFRLSNVDLGGGNIIVGAIKGTSSDEMLGAFFPNFFSAASAGVRSPNADPNGVVDAGSFIFFDPNTFAEINRIDGTSADEFFSSLGFSFIDFENILLRSPDADVDGLVDAGTVVLANINTGVEVGRTNGISAGERFGAFGASTFGITNSYIVNSPDADVGGIIDAGRVVQISLLTGEEIQSVAGISENERLGAFGSQFLNNGIFLISSPDADVDGVTDAGRFVFFDPNTLLLDPRTDFTFDNLPSDDFFVTNTRLEALLNGGATLILQANNDISSLLGADISATAGSLTLQAGRSIHLMADLEVPTLNLLANQSDIDGVDLAFRNFGFGDVLIDGATLRATNLMVEGDNFNLLFRTDVPSDPDMPTSVSRAGLFVDENLSVDVNYNFVVKGADLSAGNATVNGENLYIETIQNPANPDMVLGSTVNVAGNLTTNLERDFIIQGTTVEAGSMNVNAENFHVNYRQCRKPYRSRC